MSTTYRGSGGPKSSGTQVASQDDLDAAVRRAEQAVADAEAAAGAAAASAQQADQSASAASDSAASAAASADASADSANAAKISEDNAAASEANVEALYDDFDDRYLGAKASDPTTDNDGDPLQTGALYFNTTENLMKVWNGSAWQDFGVIGPTSAVDGNFAVFDGTSGAVIKDGGNLDDLPLGFGAAWKFKTETAAADPGSGNFRLNAATQAATTAIYVSSTSEGGIDLDELLDEIVNTQKVLLVQNSNSRKIALYTVNGTPTNNTGWWTIPVTFEDNGTGGEFELNKKVTFEFFGIGGSAGSYSRGEVDALLRYLPNVIINGDMEIHQRGGSTTGFSTGDFSVDRWTHPFVSSFVGDLSQGVGPEGGGDRSIRIDVTTGDSTVASGDFLISQQAIEGRLFKDALFGTASAKNLGLRFWYKSSVVGVHSVALRNGPSVTRSFIREFTVAQANTWEEHEVYFPGDVSGTWVTGEGDAAAYLVFTHMTGSTFATTADAWQSGNFIGTSSSVNDVATAGNVIEVDKVQLVIIDGVDVPEWRNLDYLLELERCTRYYQKLRAYWQGNTTSGSNYTTMVNYRTRVGVLPTFVLSSIGQAGFSTTVQLGGSTFDEFTTFRQATATGNASFYENEIEVIAEPT